MGKEFLDFTGLSHTVGKIKEDITKKIDASVGDLSELTTEDKTSVVAAINELMESGGITDLGALPSDSVEALGLELLNVSTPGIYKFVWVESSETPEGKGMESLLFVTEDNTTGINQILMDSHIGFATRAIGYGMTENVPWNAMLDESRVIDNLTTALENKPLSAKQGKVLKSLVDTKADKQNANGGFSAGNNANAEYTGAAIGQDALCQASGGAVGDFATSNNGGAVGQSATASNGGAVGYNAITGDGFAGGTDAHAMNANSDPIDAIQLGTGTNSEPKTLQVYDYPLMDAEGNIPSERLANAPKTTVVDNLTSTSTTDALSAKQGKALKDLVDWKADKYNNQTGGFEGGGNASVTGEGAALGAFAYANDGGAVGSAASAGDGFSGGNRAQVKSDQNGKGIDAIQLGSGYNDTPKTMQVYNKRIVEADGSLTDVGKLSDLITTAKGTVVAAINELKANGGGTGSAGGGIPDLGTLDIDLLGNPDSAFTDMSSPGVYKYSWYEPNIYGDCEGILIVSYSSSATETYQVLIDSAVGMLVRYMCNSNTWNFVLDSSHVVDNLTSVSGTDALSAKQGKMLNDTKADKQNSTGGFSAGENAVTTRGGSIGKNANSEYGGSVGYGATSTSGGAIGDNATATSGGAVGELSMANAGCAVGACALTSDGVACGNTAVCAEADGTPIDAIQLGTGTNNTPKTMQVYDYPLLDANGNIPAERLANAPKTDKENQSGGFNAGKDTYSETGGAIGNNAYSMGGGSVGYNTYSNQGGAVGEGAETDNGFAGGYNAKTTATGENGDYQIDAIQLGSGVNNMPKTLQVYDYQLMDANGNIPAERLANIGVTDLGTLDAHSREALGTELITVTDAGVYKFEWFEGVETAGEVMKSFLIVTEDNPVCSTQFLIDSYIGLSTRVIGMGSDNVPWESIVSSKNGTSKTGTLLASGWSNGTQALSVSGLTAAQNGMISIAQSATAAQRAAARKAKLSVTGQAAGALTVTADGAVPETDIPVTILLF